MGGRIFLLTGRRGGGRRGGGKEFYRLPVGHELLQYDSIAVNTIVKNRAGEVNSCDVLFSNDLAQFSADYLRLTREAAECCEKISWDLGYRPE